MTPSGLLGSRFQAPQERFATSVVPAQAGPGTSLSSGPGAAAAPQDRAAAGAAGGVETRCAGRTPLPPDSSTDTDLRDAVSRAVGQAKTMATSTASAIGDQIAQLQTIVTQPPQVCYGPAGAQRVVAVTVTYSLK